MLTFFQLLLSSLLSNSLAEPSVPWHGLAADEECQQMSLSLLQMQRSEDAKSESPRALGTSASARRAQEQAACGDREVPAVFIVSTGRSGSTTALHMLNAIPGYDLKGENMGMWQTLVSMVQQRADAHEHYGPADVYTWIRSESPNKSELLCGLQLMVLGELNPMPAARVVGFKEIRWNWDQDLADLDLLAEVFPSAKFVLNFRKDIEAQIESMESTDGDFDEDDLIEETRAIKQFHERFPERSYMLRLEDFTVETFNDLLHWLGEDKTCQYVAVAHDNAANGYTRSTGADSRYLQCKD